MRLILYTVYRISCESCDQVINCVHYVFLSTVCIIYMNGNVMIEFEGVAHWYVKFISLLCLVELVYP